MQTVRVTSRTYDGRLRDEYEAFLCSEDPERLVIYAPVGTLSYDHRAQIWIPAPDLREDGCVRHLHHRYMDKAKEFKELRMNHSDTGDGARLVIELHTLLWNESFQHARSWFLKEFVPQKFGDYASFRHAHPRGSEGDMYVSQIIDWFELGHALITHGLLSEDLYFETTPPVRMFWQPLQSVIEAARTDLHDQSIAKPFELLNERFVRWIESRKSDTQPASG